VSWRDATTRAAIGRWISTAGLVLAVGLLLVVTVRAIGSVDVDDLRLWPFVASVVLAMVWLGCLAAGWAELSGATDRSRAMFDWFRTQVLRYIPGTVWAVAARSTTVEGDRSRRWSAVVIEALTLACCALATASAIAAVCCWWWAGFGVLFVLVPIGATRVFGRRFGHTWRAVARASVWLVLGWFAYGAAGALGLAASAAGESSLRAALAALGAWAAGYLFIIAPGGVGIREAAFVALMGPVVTTDVAAAGAVTIRVATLLAEVLMLAAAFGWVSLRTRQSLSSA
jgi:uncharacterized membrane protein YbhN (UPF0104 family)